MVTTTTTIPPLRMRSVLAASLALSVTSGFTPTHTPTFTVLNSNKSKVARRRTSLWSVGGWGKRAKEYTPDEFAGEGGERTGFDAYELQERSDFIQRVRTDQKKFLKKKDEDFLEIAKMAGITDQCGDGVQPLGDFSVDDDDGFFDANDNLDVSVSFDDDDEDRGYFHQKPGKKAVLVDPDFDPATSITRMDGDNDVSGALGQW